MPTTTWGPLAIEDEIPLLTQAAATIAAGILSTRHVPDGCSEEIARGSVALARAIYLEVRTHRGIGSAARRKE